MKKLPAGLTMLTALSVVLTGCGRIGDKSASLTAVYGATAAISLVLLLVYLSITKKKDPWFLLLFISVFVVNSGYLALATSGNLARALFSNRLAYLGSVFLPLSMLMIILNVTHIRYRKWLPALLIGIGTVMFLIAASPGYLDIYYKEVTFSRQNGVSVLNKVYGPLHGLYLVYLLGYFAAMVAAVIYAARRKKVDSLSYAVLLAIAVFVNIGVWLIEQLAKIDFEMLSVSYIISELFLLGLRLLMTETEKQKELLRQAMDQRPAPEPEKRGPGVTPEQLTLFQAGLDTLTPKERQIYDQYLSGMGTAQIMQQLSIKENTLKFHNKNIYSKLGVTSRKQLLRHAAALDKQTRD